MKMDLLNSWGIYKWFRLIVHTTNIFFRIPMKRKTIAKKSIKAIKLFNLYLIFSFVEYVCLKMNTHCSYGLKFLWGQHVLR